MATRLFGSQTSLREANRANLLASIHKVGAMTQVELAEVTGLSTATVSSSSISSSTKTSWRPKAPFATVAEPLW